jgi:uncharacterized membrane protein
MADEAQQKIESYLTKLCGHFRGLSEETTREILKELQSHIMEKATADGMTMAAVDATLAALGRPEELAQEYVTDELLARAEVSRSPLRILDGLVRWASLSVAGFFVLVASITGYFLGVVFILVAALKPFHPEAAGLWAVRELPATRLSLFIWVSVTRPSLATKCWAGGSYPLDCCPVACC